MESYPILEFDLASKAFIEPSYIVEKQDVPEYCVISFFREVVEEVAEVHQAKVLAENRWQDGAHPLYEIDYKGKRLAFFQPGVGAPLSAGLLEEVIALGCRKFIVCGGCGVLGEGIHVGDMIVVTGALRDEGVSYHYLPPSRFVEAQPRGVKVLKETLQNQDMAFWVGKTWTTDAPYRETVNHITKYRNEGCIAVEMEAAALMAVAEFRNVALGYLLYSGDDLSGVEWDERAWQDQFEVRRNLFWLAADACLNL